MNKLCEEEIEKVLRKRTISEQELETIFNKEPKAIVYLYRLLNNTKFSRIQGEKLCEYLLNNYSIFDHIPTNLTYAAEAPNSELGWRYQDYRLISRDGYPKKLNDHLLREEFDDKSLDTLSEDLLAMRLFTQGRDKENPDRVECIDKLGYILDYQMPIGGTKTLLRVTEKEKYDKKDNSYPFGIKILDESNYLFSPGNCDLIAYDNMQFTILELKNTTSDEPLIRAVIEAFTYLRMLDEERATNSFRKHYENIIPKDGNIGWNAALLLYKYGKQHDEYVKDENSNLRRLMKKMDITPIWYDIKDDIFTVVEQ